MLASQCTSRWLANEKGSALLDSSSAAFACCLFRPGTSLPLMCWLHLRIWLLWSSSIADADGDNSSTIYKRASRMTHAGSGETSRQDGACFWGSPSSSGRISFGASVSSLSAVLWCCYVFLPFSLSSVPLSRPALRTDIMSSSTCSSNKYPFVLA